VLAVDLMLLEDRTGLATRGLAKLKAKLSLCIIKHHAMKMYGGQSSNSTHLTKEWKCVISLVCVFVCVCVVKIITHDTVLFARGFLRVGNLISLNKSEVDRWCLRF
jgi:hypothetical protein